MDTLWPFPMRNSESVAQQQLIQPTSSNSARRKVDDTVLAKNWRMSKLKAKNTLRVTTQRGMRSIVNPYLVQRFRSNDRHLRHRRLNTEMFTDTLTSSAEYSKGNKHAQVYATPFGWTGAYPAR